MMKQKLSIFVLLMFAVITAAFGANLFPEGNFNTPKGNRPDGWALWTWAPKGQTCAAKISLLKNSGIDNSYCVKMTNTKAVHCAVASNNYKFIPVKANKTYVARVMVKAEKGKFPPFINISAGFAKKGIKGVSKNIKLLPTENYQELKFEFTAPAGADRCRIDIKLNRPGSILLDNVSIEEVTAKAPGKTGALLHIAPFAKSPVIDGSDADKVWQDAVQFGFFQMPRQYGLPVAQTDVKAAYDAQNLYLFIRNHDKNLRYEVNQLDRLRANISLHDGNVWLDDCNEIMLHTGKNSEPVRLIINSKGVIFDVIGRKPANKFNANAVASGKLNNGFWSSEIAIPLKSIGINKVDANTKLFMNVCRTRWTGTEAEHSSWIPVGVKGFNDPDATGTVYFADKNVLQKDAFDVSENGLAVKHDVKGAKKFQIKYYVDIVNGLSGAICGTPFGFELFRNHENNIRKYTVSYTVCDGDRVIYASPRILLSAAEGIGAASSKLVRTEFGGKIEYIEPDSFYVMGGTMERLTLLLYSNAGKMPKEMTFVLEMPEFASLLYKEGYKRIPSPISVKETKFVRKNQKFRRYTMTFDGKYINSPTAFKWNHLPIPIWIEGKNRTKKDLTSEITFYAVNKEEKYTENPKKLPLVILPEIINKRAADEFVFMIWNWYPFQNVGQLPLDIADRLFDKYRRAGLNAISTELALNEKRYRMRLKKEFGLRSAKMLPTLTGAANFPFGLDHIRKYPNDAEYSLSGRKLATPAIAPILDGTSKFIPQIYKVLGGMAKEYDILHLDYEFGIYNANSPGYSKQNIEAFKKEYKLSDASIADLQNKYKKEWTRFRVAQNGNMVKLYRDAVKKANPDCLLSAYSAYQRPESQWGIYGVDWTTMGKYLDFASCGYGRGNYETTRKVLPKNMKIMGGIGVFGFDRDLRRAAIDAFRRISDANSFMIFTSENSDGRIWHAAARAVALVNAYPEFFRINNRQDVLAAPKQDAVSILQSGGKRLVLLFNEDKNPRTIRFRNLKLAANLKAIDFESGAAVNPYGNQSFKLAPFEVKVIVIGNADELKSRSANAPAPKLDAVKEPENKIIENSGIWQPVDWSSFPCNVDNIGYDFNVKRSGDYSLFIKHGGFGVPYWTNFRFLSTGQILPLSKKGEKWQFRCFVKTTPGMKVRLSITFRNENNIGTKVVNKVFGPFADWTEVVLEAESPKDNLYVSCGLSGVGAKGTAWIEPVALQKK